MKLNELVLNVVPDFKALVCACQDNPEYLLNIKEFERKLVFEINFPAECKFLVQNSNGDLVVGKKEPYIIVINRAKRWFFQTQCSTKLKAHQKLAEDWSTTVTLRSDFIKALFQRVKEAV